MKEFHFLLAPSSRAPNGKEFRIYDIDAFMREVTPVYFYKHSNNSNLNRQLSLWGFDRIGNTRQKKCAWRHALFLRDKPELITSMMRSSGKTNRLGKLESRSQSPSVATSTTTRKIDVSNSNSRHAINLARAADINDGVRNTLAKLEKKEVVLSTVLSSPRPSPVRNSNYPKPASIKTEAPPFPQHPLPTPEKVDGRDMNHAMSLLLHPSCHPAELSNHEMKKILSSCSLVGMYGENPDDPETTSLEAAVSQIEGRSTNVPHQVRVLDQSVASLMGSISNNEGRCQDEGGNADNSVAKDKFSDCRDVNIMMNFDDEDDTSFLDSLGLECLDCV